MFMGWCFFSHLVLRCTNRHRNKPIFSCLCLWGGAFTCILYFGVQTGTNTSLFNRGLVVYVYGMVLLTATCTSLYKQAPKQSLFYLYMFMKWCFYSHFVRRFTSRHQNKPIFSCLCLWDGAFRLILYFGVQTGTKQTFFSCLCLWGGAFTRIFCTSVYKQAPKQTYF